jgi:hypothetical protein
MFWSPVKKIWKKNLKKDSKKSQIRIQVGLTTLSTSPVRNQSELDSLVSFGQFWTANFDWP